MIFIYLYISSIMSLSIREEIDCLVHPINLLPYPENRLGELNAISPVLRGLEMSITRI